MKMIYNLKIGQKYAELSRERNPVPTVDTDYLFIILAKWQHWEVSNVVELDNLRSVKK